MCMMRRMIMSREGASEEEEQLDVGGQCQDEELESGGESWRGVREEYG